MPADPPNAAPAGIIARDIRQAQVALSGAIRQTSLDRRERRLIVKIKANGRVYTERCEVETKDT